MKTDDVLKALEQCVNGVDSCGGCPLIGCFECRSVLLVHALYTINSQNAEIELLKLENKKLHETNNTLNYQVDVWSPNETIETFAEKMKGVIPEIDDTYIERIVEDYIEKTVNEMTEEHNAPHNNDDD